MPERFLIVEKDGTTAEGLVRWAERHGYATYATTDSAELGRLVRALNPAVVALSCDLEGTDPIDLVAAVASAAPGVRLVLLSRAGRLLEICRHAALLLGIRSAETHGTPIDFRAFSPAETGRRAFAG